MAIGIAAVWSTLFLAFRNSWAYMFNNDIEVVKLVASILPLVALFQVFDGTGAITGGIFRARGKQFTSALLNLSAYYVLGIPLGLYLAFSLHMALPGLWLGLTLALIYSSTVGLWIGVLRADWAEEAIRAKGRVGGDKPDGGPQAVGEVVGEY
ncbi:hypothetical protein F5I97DRAFT_1931629 [Phlebopus sp. FC_14]|nr:hypothetical protein F5I97DRAFT_1931629 [Phlebopus sp. FC_14]